MAIARGLSFVEHRSVRAALVCLLLVACGDNLSFTLDSYSVEDRDALFRWRVRCGLLRSMDECVALYPTHLHPDLVAVVDEGLTEFQAGVAYDCVQWIDSLGCDPTEAEYKESHCFPIYTGTLHDGAACASDLECISGECWQEGLDCGEACCFGVCTGDTPPTLGQIGDRCRYSGCADGWCHGSVCEAFLPEGATCEGTYQCDVGLSCTGTCQRLPSAGESCTNACREYGQACTTNRVCERARLQGEHCWVNADCSPYYACAANNLCVSVAARLGEYCALSRCEQPYACDSQTYKCIVPKADGDRCGYSGECASYSCSPFTGTCTSETCT